MRYNKAITIQVQDPQTEQWADKWQLHAQVNKARGSQAQEAGADQYRAALTFKVRYFAALEAMRYNPQPYRIIYRGHAFKLTDWDDYMEQHLEVTLTGEAYG